MNVKLTKEELFSKAQERFNSWAKMYSDPNITVQQMYEDMSCSCYSGDANYDKMTNDKPVLDQNLRFSYRGYDFELSSCTNITSKSQIIGLTDENFKQRFPHGVFTDRYVCWMFGHKDYDGYTKDYVDDPEDWSPEIYLVPYAWSWGAECVLVPGNKVAKYVLADIDKFLETFKE